MDRKYFSAWLPRTKALVLLAFLFGFTTLPNPFVDAFRSINFGVNGSHPSFYYGTRHRQPLKIDTFGTMLRARRGQIEIRDCRFTDTESKKIYDFLLQRERQERIKTKTFFDPEGSLELDVSDRWTLAESYSQDDGGCFLVAVESDTDQESAERIVGTLGMIAGDQVLYQSSGSSMAQSGVTAALRRVCAMEMANDSDGMSTKDILEALIQKGEERALQAGATNLICMAYPETIESDLSDQAEASLSIFKPTVGLFESLGYTISDQQIPGVATIQFEKGLSKNEQNTPGIKIQGGEWILPATIASLVSIAWLVFNLYVNVFGIEQLWGSVDNGGVGTSLSSQNLEELIRDEKLGRSGLDDAFGSATTRQWEDLSPEELREEQALMKIIQGQSIRTK